MYPLRSLRPLRLNLRPLVLREKRFAGQLAAFCVTAREIDAADRAITSVRPDRRARIVEGVVENVLTMFSRPLAVVHDQRDDDVARARSAVGNIFTPAPAPGAVTIEAFRGIAAIGSVMTKIAVRLVSHMFNGSHRHSRRRHQSAKRTSTLEETNSFIDRGHALMCAHASAAGENEEVAEKTAAHLRDIAGVNIWVLPGQIHFTNNARATEWTCGINFGSEETGCENLRYDDKECGKSHSSNYSKRGATFCAPIILSG